MSPKAIISDYLLSIDQQELIPFLEYPTDVTMGDIALPCFQLARERKQSPAQIALDLSVTLPTHDSIQRVEAVGPYVNFFLNRDHLSNDLFGEVISSASYGQGSPKNETILIESPGPNTNKPLHLGHVRNMLLGNSLANILDFAGYQVKKVDIINDRGIHICKSMLAYQKVTSNKQPVTSNRQPSKKSDHFVGDCYVAYDKGLKEHPEREQEIQDMLIKRENGDPETIALRKKMNKRALDGQAETYKRYGTHIDKAYLESDHYLKGKALVEQGIQDGIFYANEKGNIVADLTQEMGQEKTVLRADGTSIYMTQDLALGKLRYDDFCMDRMIYVVGNEQEDHFKALFLLFKKLGYSFADACYHLSYGMIELPDGKMKSREGNVVDADWLADEMHTRVRELLQERYPDLDAMEAERRAEIIAMAAISFFILKYDAKKGFVFNREHSLDFAGETGPYMLYTYARIQSIITSGMLIPMDEGSNKYSRQEEEKVLLHSISTFPEIIQQSAQEYAPNVLLRYLFALAGQCNSYYHHTKIIQKDTEGNIIAATIGAARKRMLLLRSTGNVLQKGLDLLGIKVLDSM